MISTIPAKHFRLNATNHALAFAHERCWGGASWQASSHVSACTCNYFYQTTANDTSRDTVLKLNSSTNVPLQGCDGACGGGDAAAAVGDGV
jgi:hypothetical protein